MDWKGTIYDSIETNPIRIIIICCIVFVCEKVKVVE